MFDLASSKAGAFVSCATSNDENHPASNIIDGDESTYWMTTGLYPQVVVITFPQQVEFKSIHIKCTGVKYCVLESSSKSHPADFEPIAEQSSLENDDRKLQCLDITLSKQATAKHVKLTILSGHKSFSSVHQIKIDGKGSR